MKHRFNIPQMLLSAAGYKGLIYPGIFMGRLNRTGSVTRGGDFEIPQAAELQRETSTGTPIYAPDPNRPGRYYFMPVILGGVEIPAAVIAISGQKIIQQTPLPGQGGSVKELIYADDWTIQITGMLWNTGRTYPEQELVRMRELCMRDESVSLICALSDILLEGSDQVVIKKYDFPAMGGVEDMQLVKLECVTDALFELEIE